VKYKFDRNIERFKARLVVRGDHQLEGFGFSEAFAPVAKMASVRVLLYVVVAKRMGTTPDERQQCLYA